MVIAISRRSWHYRVWKFAQDPARIYDRWMTPTAGQLERRMNEPTAICGYFWTLVFTPWLCFMTIVVFPLLLAVFAILISPFYGCYRLGKWLVGKARRDEQPDQPPSLLVTAIKASKARICPRVTVAP